MDIGARITPEGACHFTVWAPLRNSIELHLIAPHDHIIPMHKDPQGYWHTSIDRIPDHTLYKYRIDGHQERPDPASASQPHGVHGPSRVVDHRFAWTDEGWKGIPLSTYIIYELHTGTFTTEGTFDAIVPRLDALKDLGITAIEVMPVAQFPGDRNWGYDGAYTFAVQESYGGANGLKRLVNACHARGLAFILDVVYNHFGPEGNYTREYGPYFTPRYKTPWGDALNFDGPNSDEVRNYFIQNALSWFRDYHVDALRLDAIHAIIDVSAFSFLQELSAAVAAFSQQTPHPCYLIAESDSNDPRVVSPREQNGLGMDAQWSDDLHHSLQTLLVEGEGGYYSDFGRVEQLGTAIADGFVYAGQYSQFRKHRHGGSSKDLPAGAFVVCSQNHDQVGNRLLGERNSVRMPLEKLKLAASVILLSPNIPLLFMGEEYAEEAPFLYFVSHEDTALVESVRRGRKEEFADFLFTGEALDPVDPATFQRSKLGWEKQEQGNHKTVRDYYRALIAMRQETAAFSRLDKKSMKVQVIGESKTVLLERWAEAQRVVCCFALHESGSWDLRLPEGSWRKIFDSADQLWNGPGGSAPDRIDGTAPVSLHAFNCVVYQHES